MSGVHEDHCLTRKISQNRNRDWGLGATLTHHLLLLSSSTTPTILVKGAVRARKTSLKPEDKICFIQIINTQCLKEILGQVISPILHKTFMQYFFFLQAYFSLEPIPLHKQMPLIKTHQKREVFINTRISSQAW